jgi:hypothetical protein
MIFIAGTGDTPTATGGTKTVRCIRAEHGDHRPGRRYDPFRRFRKHDGCRQRKQPPRGQRLGQHDRASDGGQRYDDIFGWVMQNRDTFDLRSAPVQTGWNGDPSTLGQFVQVSMTGNDAVISIDPAGTSGASGSALATLHDSGATDYSTLLAHAITS